MKPCVLELVSQAKQRIREIAPQELDGATARGAVVVDVREPAEYAAGHLPHAINLPRGILEFHIYAHPAIVDAATPHAVPLVLYCLTGGRSALAADTLQRLGFEQVSSLSGGITAWCQAGLPLTAAKERSP